MIRQFLVLSWLPFLTSPPQLSRLEGWFVLRVTLNGPNDSYSREKTTGIRASLPAPLQASVPRKPLLLPASSDSLEGLAVGKSADTLCHLQSYLLQS